MKGEELINVCQAAAHGDVRYVRNVRSNREGLVVAANGPEVEVRVGAKSEVWKIEECEELTKGQA